MFNPDLSLSSSLIHHLSSEISDLTEQQTDALLLSTLVGMTEDEAIAYEERQGRIRQLMSELSLVTSKRPA